MATTNIQSFAGDVEVTGELTVTGQLNSTTGSDKVKLTATTASETDYIPLSKGTAGAQALYTDSNLTYNPANNVIGANVSGNASFATNATYANSAGSATNATFANSATNATYANSATHANAANTVAFTSRDATDNTDYIAFVEGHDNGDRALFTDQNLTYNSANNHINANVPYANAAGSATNATYANQAGYVVGGVCKYYLKYVTTQRMYPSSTNVHIYDMDFNYAAERSNSTLVIQYSLFYEAVNNRNFVTYVNNSYYPYNMGNVKYGVAVNNYDVETDTTPHSFMFTVHYAPGTTANKTYKIYNRSSTNSAQGFALNRTWRTGPQNAEFGVSYALVQEFAA